MPATFHWNDKITIVGASLLEGGMSDVDLLADTPLREQARSHREQR